MRQFTKLALFLVFCAAATTHALQINPSDAPGTVPTESTTTNTETAPAAPVDWQSTIAALLAMITSLQGKLDKPKVKDISPSIPESVEIPILASTTTTTTTTTAAPTTTTTTEAPQVSTTEAVQEQDTREPASSVESEKLTPIFEILEKLADAILGAEISTTIRPKIETVDAPDSKDGQDVLKGLVTADDTKIKEVVEQLDNFARQDPADMNKEDLANLLVDAVVEDDKSKQKEDDDEIFSIPSDWVYSETWTLFFPPEKRRITRQVITQNYINLSVF